MKKGVSIIVSAALLSVLLMVFTTQAQVTPGTINAKQSGTWNITNISGTISLPTGAATGVAQGSATAGQVGTLAQGAVTTVAPSYTNGQTSPLSLQTDGSLRAAITNTITTTTGALGTFGSAQQAVIATEGALGTNTSKQVCVKALTANVLTVYVGTTGVTTGTGMELAPGDSQCLSLSNTNLVHVIASGVGSSVSYDWIN
jgi:hypothetical protein